MTVNDGERRRWNDERWTTYWPDREELTIPATPMVARHLALAPGQRVLDIGSGGGRATIAWARAVGDTGRVVGADLSAALVELATSRATDAGASNLSFVVADAQVDRIPGSPFDVAVSEFGVMFFDEPVTAFANIRAHIRPSGRLVFACWQPVERNPWHVNAVLGGLLPTPPAPAAGKSPPGPFTLGVPEHTRAILEAAGFTAVEHAAYDVAAEASPAAVFTPAVLPVMGVARSDLQAATAMAQAHLATFDTGGGSYVFPLAFLVFEATNPPR